MPMQMGLKKNLANCNLKFFIGIKKFFSIKLWLTLAILKCPILIDWDEESNPESIFQIFPIRTCNFLLSNDHPVKLCSIVVVCVISNRAKNVFKWIRQRCHTMVHCSKKLTFQFSGTNRGSKSCCIFSDWAV